jgi:hypothetical protein
VDVEELSPR